MGEIIIYNDPLTVGLLHNDIPVDQVDDGFGGIADVYEITDIHCINTTGTPWEFVVQPEIGEETSINIPAAREFRIARKWQD